MRTFLLAAAMLISALVACAPHRGPRVHTTSLDGMPTDPLASRTPATVLIFTRTDCPVSNRYAPEVNRLADAYRWKGVRFFLVYVDPGESPATVSRHVADFAYTPTPILDPGHTLVAQTGATITPEAAVFDRTGALTYRGRINDLYVQVGNPRARATTRDLADAIDATLAGRTVATPRTTAVGCIIADLKR